LSGFGFGKRKIGKEKNGRIDEITSFLLPLSFALGS